MKGKREGNSFWIKLAVRVLHVTTLLATACVTSCARARARAKKKRGDATEEF